MKITTDRALQPATSPRDILHRIAWAADEQDPELAAAAIGVLSELEAAEAEVERLKMEAADRSAVTAEQMALPVRERPHILPVSEEADELIDRLIAERVPQPVGLRIVGGG
ncbi:hypothetical protein LCGC14_0436930 [marine sediment metagenome]|uniref:Uncharacterized protein n=1 Tax=marine sediment metagenome TaxID=412755 RepID=A0A0F9SST8_9ZZZZ